MRIRAILLLSCFPALLPLLAAAQSLSPASPEQVGMSLTAAGKNRHSAEERDRRGPLARCRRGGRAQRQARLLRQLRRARQSQQHADDQGFDLSHLLDDQAFGFRSRNAAGRGRQHPAHRPGVQVSACLRQDSGECGQPQRDRQRCLRRRAGRTSDDGAGPVAPHRRSRLRRDHQQSKREGSLRESIAVQGRRDGIRSARHDSGGTSRAPGRHPAGSPARHRVGVQHGIGRARPRRRSGLGQAPVRVSRGAFVRPLTDARHWHSL